MGTLKYYFPRHCLFKNIRFDTNSLLYMSRRVDAELISGIIIKHLNDFGLEYKKITITDATAGIGGNTFSFFHLFEYVNAVEVHRGTFEMLETNLKECGCKNVTLINDDYVKIMNNLKQQVVFIDPPWGGREYKKYKNLTLTLSSVHVEDICSKLLSSKNIVVLKLPLNYSFDQIYGKLYNKKNKIFVHKLQKMYIILIKRIS